MKANNPLPVTEMLSRYVSRLNYENLPDPIVDRVKLLFLEYLRVAVLGSQRVWSKKIYKLVKGLGGKGRSQILIYGGTTDPPRASLINGTFAGGLDWDDTHVGSMLHPGIVVFPAALAIAGWLNSSGKQLITAIIAGYEAMIRIGLSVQPSHF